MGKNVYFIARKIRQGFTKLYSIYMTWKLRIYGAKVGKRVIFKHPIELYNPFALEIGDDTIVHEFVALKAPENGKIKIGKRCKINRYNQIEGKEINIGDDAVFGPGIHIVGSDHGFLKGTIIRKQHGKPAPVNIENDVWLGSKVIVTKGVTIGKGSVIGASAVVTKDIPEYSIAVGMPAKVIKKRE